MAKRKEQAKPSRPERISRSKASRWPAVLLSLIVVGSFAYSMFVDSLLERPADYDNTKIYDLTAANAPALSGMTLKVYVWLLENSPLSALLIRYVLHIANLGEVIRFASHIQKQYEDRGDVLPLTLYPSVPPSDELLRLAEQAAKDFSLESFSKNNSAGPNGFRFWTIDDYAKAYETKTTTPLEVAKKILESIRDSNARDPPLRAVREYNQNILIREAQESTDRYSKGNPLSYLDGIPFVVKDEMRVKGYHATAGTSFLGVDESTYDATIVGKLRNAGALMVGITTMQEIGIDVYGHNVHHGIVRNAYNTEHYAGGSSSGSASSVGLGLVPLAIGLDGGGSIRIPAAFNGVVGLKATFGRISEHGAVPLCWTVSHAGPIGATVRDVALGYVAMAGKDAHDTFSMIQPPVHLANFNNHDLTGIKIGIFRDYNDDADFQIRAAVADTIRNLTLRGAQIVDIQIPHMEAIAKSHTLTILSEMATTQERYLKSNRSAFGWSTRANLAYGGSLKGSHYLAAQQIRTWGYKMLEEQVWSKVDLVLSPATSVPPPRILAENLANGFSDATLTLKIMRFIYIGNFFGNPAITMPVSYTREENLPIAVQLMGRNWEEHVVLRVANALEKDVMRRKPEVFYSNL
eukprot:TRINITY_DN2239_c0_g1_i4.p1 TRINITY_DN2239_c0_g1~~TRINITY_DN2239_c0_g1_i4.p1  ORF type:complete len:634 (+),score=106.96 TRINITY_DN2239_c0_g1_i4:237-2138(+)